MDNILNHITFSLRHVLSEGKKLSEFCQWLLTDAEGLTTVEQQVAYQTLITIYNIVDDEEVKRQIGRKVWEPDYDGLPGYLYEGMPPDIREKFIQSFLRVDSPEVGAQRILGVDSPGGVVQKVLGVDSLDEAILKLQIARRKR